MDELKNEMVESLEEVDFTHMQVPMAVIYDSPKDFPGVYVCRIWEAVGCKATDIVMLNNTLEEMREDIREAGFVYCFERTESDDPVIVETWIR